MRLELTIMSSEILETSHFNRKSWAAGAHFELKTPSEAAPMIPSGPAPLYTCIKVATQTTVDKTRKIVTAARRKRRAHEVGNPRCLGDVWGVLKKIRQLTSLQRKWWLPELKNILYKYGTSLIIFTTIRDIPYPRQVTAVTRSSICSKGRSSGVAIEPKDMASKRQEWRELKDWSFNLIKAC